MNRNWESVDPTQYIDDYNVHQILKDAIAELCQKRPQRPYAYLRDYFGRLEHSSNNRSNSMDSTESQQSGTG
jgi:cAMP-dependent protein kinase regulator